MEAKWDDTDYCLSYDTATHVANLKDIICSSKGFLKSRITSDKMCKWSSKEIPQHLNLQCNALFGSTTVLSVNNCSPRPISLKHITYQMPNWGYNSFHTDQGRPFDLTYLHSYDFPARFIIPIHVKTLETQNISSNLLITHMGSCAIFDVKEIQG